MLRAGLTWTRKVEKGRFVQPSFNMAAETLVMCYPALAGGTLRGRPAPRFRTIQVSPKDLPTLLRQADRAVNRLLGPSPAGSHPRRDMARGRKPMFDIRRRQFITLLGGAAAWPLAAHAQQPERVGRIGVLMAYAQNDREYQSYLAAFREELQKLGWTEGR